CGQFGPKPMRDIKGKARKNDWHQSEKQTRERYCSNHQMRSPWFEPGFSSGTSDLKAISPILRKRQYSGVLGESLASSSSPPNRNARSTIDKPARTTIAPSRRLLRASVFRSIVLLDICRCSSVAILALQRIKSLAVR